MIPEDPECVSLDDDVGCSSSWLAGRKYGPTFHSLLSLVDEEEDEMDVSDCESIDSGLENSTGNSPGESTDYLDEEDVEEVEDRHDDNEEDQVKEEEQRTGDTFSKSIKSLDLDNGESIYENAEVLKATSGNIGTVLETYQFGEQEGLSVTFQDIENFDTRSQVEDKTRGTWGVRGVTPATSPPIRGSNPTEDKIAKEIRELKEREEELLKRREELSSQEGVNEVESKTVTNEETKETTKPKPVKETEEKQTVKPVSESDVKSQQKQMVKSPDSGKFNPSLYRPVIVPSRPRIMQDFIANGGKVTAFTQPDNTVIQLRKPQVYKSVPKVSPPVGTVRQPTASVLDKIQAELVETRQREEELKRRRKDLFRSQPDLTRIETKDNNKDKEEDKKDVEETESDNSAESENEDQPLSMLHTRGKSGLISVWENRIKCEKAV